MQNISVIPVGPKPKNSDRKFADRNSYIYVKGQFWQKDVIAERGIMVLTSTKTGQQIAVDLM